MLSDGHVLELWGDKRRANHPGLACSRQSLLTLRFVAKSKVAPRHPHLPTHPFRHRLHRDISYYDLYRKTTSKQLDFLLRRDDFDSCRITEQADVSHCNSLTLFHSTGHIKRVSTARLCCVTLTQQHSFTETRQIDFPHPFFDCRFSPYWILGWTLEETSFN